MLFFLASQRLPEYLPYISLILLVFILHACGFQLRGSLNLSEELSPIYLQQNSAFELAREIKTMLAANNILLEQDINKAHANEIKTQLTILNEVKSRRVLSVDASGRAREYLLNYTVNFAIKIKQPEAMQEKDIEAKDIEDSISLSRSLLFDPDAVLAVDHESEILYKDMQRDAARLILLKLQARSRNKQNNNTDKNNSASDKAENNNSQ